MQKTKVSVRVPFISRIAYSLFTLMLAAGLLVSCSKEPIRQVTGPEVPPPDDSISFDRGFFIVNEGNYRGGNASITYIDEQTGQVEQDLFKRINNQPLGDVAQSMQVINGKGYIVVNNSDKIEVVDLKTFSSIATIEGFDLPRYIEFIDSTKAYVTNMMKDIAVVDLVNNRISHTIKTTEWTESMIRYQQYMFVTCIGRFNETSATRKAKVLVINTKEDIIIDSIQTSKEPIGIALDKKHKVWVLCAGGWDGYESPALLRIDPGLREVEKAFVFPAGSSVPSRLCINPSGDTLYYLNQGIYQMPVAALSIPDQPFVQASGHLFYGLAIHPVNGTVFATDAINYTQLGKAFCYHPATGNLLGYWTTGTIPGSFCFGDLRNPKLTN